MSQADRDFLKTVVAENSGYTEEQVREAAVMILIDSRRVSQKMYGAMRPNGQIDPQVRATILETHLNFLDSMSRLPGNWGLSDPREGRSFAFGWEPDTFDGNSGRRTRFNTRETPHIMSSMSEIPQLETICPSCKGKGGEEEQGKKVFDLMRHNFRAMLANVNEYPD